MVMYMDNIKIDFMNVISNVFTSVMKAQEEYIRHSDYRNLSLTEMHVLEAVKKESFPTMGNREFDSCLHFFTNQIAQNVDYINAFEFFYCQIFEIICSNT